MLSATLIDIPKNLFAIFLQMALVNEGFYLQSTKKIKLESNK